MSSSGSAAGRPGVVPLHQPRRKQHDDSHNERRAADGLQL